MLCQSEQSQETRNVHIYNYAGNERTKAALWHRRAFFSQRHHAVEQLDRISDDCRGRDARPGLLADSAGATTVGRPYRQLKTDLKRGAVSPDTAPLTFIRLLQVVASYACRRS